MPNAKRRRQVVVTFDERHDLRSACLRGGKGASLADMRALGLPVPPGFTITTTVARAAMQHGVFPKRFEWHLMRGMQELERATGKKFGDVKNPLLLSVRSGAEISMPGMMDTILNLGINEDIAESMEAVMGTQFVRDCQHRFGVMFRAVVDTDAAPSDPWEQLRAAIGAVFDSWRSERAVAYRKANNIPENLGTAVNVQAMVFGNLNAASGTGVVFSADPNTGSPGLYGEFLPCAQGEDVVSGSHTPMPIAAMREWNESVYQELESYVARLENHHDSIVDIEFTVEDGKLWLLQCRPAKLSVEAKATFAVHRVWKKRWTKEQALQTLTPQEIKSLDQQPVFTPEEVQNAIVLARGIAASAGAATGAICTTKEDAIDASQAGLDVVLVRSDTNPDDLSGMLVAKAIVTAHGGATSHAAVVARQLGIPAVVGVGDEYLSVLLRSEKTISVCGTTGTVYDGALQVATPERKNKKEINLFLKWYKFIMPPPRINFEAVDSHISVNAVLANVYLLEAMVLAAEGSTIEGEVVKARNKTLVDAAELFACYLAIAVASELRHAPRTISSALSDILANAYGITEDRKRGDVEILSVLKPLTLEQQANFFRFAEKVFRAEGWRRAYGGFKWADIAEAGHRFLSGEWKHGLFVDRVFDLRHNGGTLFDKHIMVSLYTSEISLREQLDYKKTHYTVGDLYKYFGGILGLQSGPHFASVVTTLWEEGKKKHLWKDVKDEERKIWSSRW